jgi:hypothetical protein
MLKSKVQQICSGRPTPFKGGMHGTKWWGFFKIRHPHLMLRTPQALDGKRTQNVTKEKCESFYNLLERIYAKTSYSPSHVWNVDESGLSASIKIGGVKVIAMKGSKAVLSRIPESREWTTVVVCVSVSRDKIPSHYIFTGKEFCGNYLIGCEPNARMSMQPSGWMYHEICVEWLKYFRSCVCRGVSVENLHLLLLDGHSSHLSEEAILLRSMGLEMVCKPPHSSHRL